MPNKSEDALKLQNLKNGESCTINWCEEGGGEVHRVWDVYILFEVPMYGGEPKYEGTYRRIQLDAVLNKAYEWT